MYREVTMIEFREVLRLWQEQVPKKRIATQLGLDPKTVRRYLRAAEAAELRAPMEALSDEQVRDVLLALQPSGGRPHGEDWTRCGEQPRYPTWRPPSRKDIGRPRCSISWGSARGNSTISAKNFSRLTAGGLMRGSKRLKRLY